MIFISRLVHAIVAGRKTQFRLLVREDQACPYEVGHSYTIQRGRGQDEVVRIRVTKVRTELLHEISPQDIAREGFRSWREFRDAWWDKYRSGPGPGPPAREWIEIPTWVVEFELDREHRPHLLSTSVIAGKRGAYTTNTREALDEEAGEAVDSATLKRFTRDAHERDETAKRRRQAERAAESLRDRVDELERAKRNGEDVDRDLARVRAALDVADKKRRRRGTRT